MFASESRSAVVMRLAEEFLERYRQGQRPSLKEYIDRHPELAGDIKEVFPAMALMENIALADESLAGVATGPEIASGAAPPEQLGDYRILREVGRGGMGIVYEAEQVSLGRHVALKVLPRKVLLDEAQKRRFEREAKAAAKLHHTNIVPVFGVGEHDGLPYYVMQFIQGLGLDGVLDELKHMQGSGKAAEVARSLLTGALQGPIEGVASSAVATSGSLVDSQPASEPLAATSSVKLPSSHVKGKKASYWQSVAHIGVQVADALEHAHKQGIQHRDIKPSNLLLDTAGTVWVTDFGLARADNEDHLTNTGDIVGTLRYMPPEAFEGCADKRGDIYSLGLTLYEMLARKPAFEERDRHRLIKRVTTEEPARLDKLNRAMPRDLVTIVHKAIDREPSRRYQTAGGLSADLQRFLDDEPIRARRISNGERLLRWCRHHPGVASLAAILILLLIGVTAASLLAAAHFDRAANREAKLAEKERLARQEAEQAKEHEAALRQQADEAKKQAISNFAKARKAVDDYFTTVSESQLLQVPGMQPLRRDLLQSALTFYQDFLKQHGDPTLLGELAAAYLRVGKIRVELDEHAEALKAYERARALYEALTKAAPESVGWRHGLAQCYFQLGRHKDAIVLWEKLVQPGQPRYQKELAQVYSIQGKGYSMAGRLTEALQDHQRALAIRKMLVHLNPADAEAQRELGETLFNIGTLYQKPWYTEYALPMVRLAAEHAEAAFAQAPQVLSNGRFLAECQNRIADIELMNAHEKEALTAFRRAVEVWQKLAWDNPAVLSLRRGLFAAYGTLALYQHQLKRSAQADRTVRLARDLIERLPRDGPDALFNLACVRAECAFFLAHLKEKPTAQDRAEQKQEADLAMEALRKAVAEGFRDLRWFRTAVELRGLRDRADYKALQANLAARVAAGPDMSKESQRTLTLGQKMAQADPQNKRLRAALAATQHAIAHIQFDLGKPNEAQQHLQQAIALRQALVEEEPANAQHMADLAASRSIVGDFYWNSGRLKEGDTCWLQVLAWLEERLGNNHDAILKEQLAAIHRRRGHAYGQAGLYEEAAAELESAFALQPDYVKDGENWMARGALAIQLGKPDHFRRIVLDYEKLPASFAHSHYLARLNMLAPGAFTDPASAVTAAQEEYGLTFPSWRLFVLGTAHYRAGHYADAERLIRESMQFTRNLELLSHRWFWLALVCQRQGKAEEAKKWLQMGVQWMNRGDVTTPPNGGPGNRHWYQALELRLLRREAEMLVIGKATPEPMDIVLKRAQAYVRLDQPKKAETAFQAAATARPNDPAVWLTRGRAFAELGWKDRADAAFAKAAALTPEELDRFPQAGWWVVGPYPEDPKLPCPPEKNADPSRPVAAAGHAEELRWRPAPTNPDGKVDLRTIFNADRIAAYALTYVYSPDERTATLFVGGDDGLRVWLNGRLVHEHEGWWISDRVPVTLKAGRNTLLCKVSNRAGPHHFHLRIADNLLGRAQLHAALGLWDEAAAEFARGIDRQAFVEPNIYVRCVHAQLLVGDSAGYRRYLERMLERYDGNIPRYDWSAAYAGGLLDGAVETKRLVELAERALKRAFGPFNYSHVAGIAYYRAGQFDKAIVRLEKSLKNPDWQSGAGHASELGLALTHNRLGHAKEARQWLDKAEQWYDKAVQDALASATGTANLYNWKDWPSFVVLRREAHKQILGKYLPDDPRLKRLADRMRDRLKKLDKATADYDVALLLSPNEARLWQARGQRLSELKRSKEAEADFAKARTLIEGNKAQPKK